MADVLAFPRRDDDQIVWRCNCGCISFELRANGSAVCFHCGHFVTGHEGEWRLPLPDAPEAPKELEPGAIRVTDMNNSGASMRRALGKVDVDDTAAVVVLQKDGTITTWGLLEGSEQLEWFDRGVQTAKSMLTKNEG